MNARDKCLIEIHRKIIAVYGWQLKCNFYLSGSSRSNLTTVIKKVGDTYNDIGKLFEEQPKLDWEPLGDMLHIYKGILAAFPDILSFHRVSYYNFLQMLLWLLFLYRYLIVYKLFSSMLYGSKGDLGMHSPKS